MNRSEPLTDLSKLLAEARSMTLARSTVAAFSAAHTVEQMQEGLARAVDAGDVPAATALALAIGAAGSRIAPEMAIRLIPDLEAIQHFPIIAGITDGDRLVMLLDLVEEQHVSWEREALALYLATQLLDGAEPPQRLVTALRALARQPTEPPVALLVAAAARAIGNPHLSTLASRMIPAAGVAERRGAYRAVIAGFFEPVLDSLPAEAARIIGSGYTVVRPEPKAGRNDPCPCGSGKKFKKCHGGQQEGTPGRQALVEHFQKLGARGGKIQDRIFDGLRPGEMAQLNPDELTTRQLVAGSRKLGWHRRWEDAERYMDALATRTDVRDGFTGKDFRIELADDALEAGNLDFAERQFALATVSEKQATGFRLRLALARKAPDALEQLESAAATAHSSGDPTLLYDCAFGLLRYSPALGILAARGCIDRERFLDSETLLKDIEGARDRLGLPPKEPWWEIFDLLLDEGLEPEPMTSAPNEEESRRQREIDQMRGDLQAAQSRASRLDKELSRRVEQLESLSGEREQLAAIVQASGGGEYQKRVAALEEERQRLRKKIGELKGEISEGTSQRAALRRELAETADALRKESRAAASAEDADEHEEDDEAEGESAAVGPRKILVPQFTPAASRSLGELPQRVAADSLRLTALLACGDPHAWSGVKHMHGVHDILSIRVGRPYRILFRVSDERLDVLDLTLRRDLDIALQRLAGR